MNPLLNVKEAAEFLNVAEATIYRLARVGTLPHTRIGRSIRFSTEMLEEYINSPTAPAPESTTKRRPSIRL
jgi:excisionase family DNA binding protein